METTKTSCLARQELGRQNGELVREQAKITRVFKEVLETDNTHVRTNTELGNTRASFYSVNNVNT